MNNCAIFWRISVVLLELLLNLILDFVSVVLRSVIICMAHQQFITLYELSRTNLGARIKDFTSFTALCNLYTNNPVPDMDYIMWSLQYPDGFSKYYRLFITLWVYKLYPKTEHFVSNKLH